MTVVPFNEALEAKDRRRATTEKEMTGFERGIIFVDRCLEWRVGPLGDRRQGGLISAHFVPNPNPNLIGPTNNTL